MDTISHGFWAYLLFRHYPWVFKFILGSVFIDIPFIAGSIYLIIQNKSIPAQLPLKVLNLGYLTTFAFALHSLVVWALAFTFSYFFLRNWLPFVWGWGLHILIDMLTHISDGFPLFWPLKYEVIGLVSYWETRFHSISFNLIQLTLLIILFIYSFYIKK